jgi:hypothetical protein
MIDARTCGSRIYRILQRRPRMEAEYPASEQMSRNSVRAVYLFERSMNCWQMTSDSTCGSGELDHHGMTKRATKSS